MSRFLAKIKIEMVRKRKLFLFVQRCNVSYDTLAGIPWMSHSRITKISERVSREGPYDKITWEKLSERIKAISSSFNVIEIGRILQAYATVQYRDVKLIHKLIEEIKKKEAVKEMDLLACASICHALNNLNFMDKELFHLLFATIKKLDINKYSSFPIVIIQNAYSKHCNEKSFRHMALQLLLFFFKHFDKYKVHCTPQGLAMLLNSFAQILKPSPDFLKDQNTNLSPICINESNCQSFVTDADAVETDSFSAEKVVCLTHSNTDSLNCETKEESQTGSTRKDSSLFGDVSQKCVLKENAFVNMEKNQIEIHKEEKNELLTEQEREHRRVSNLNGKETCEIIENEELLAKYFFKLLLEISKKLEQMTVHSLALIINSCTRIYFQTSPEFLRMLAEETNRKIHLASIRHLSLIINGYIKLQLNEPIFLSNVFNEIEKKIFSCDSQQLCFILSSMCKLNKRNEQLLKNINSKFILIVRKMNISTLCNVFYYYTKLGVYDSDLFKLYEMYVKKSIHEATIHHLSLAAYVLSKKAKKEKKENELLPLIVQKAEQMIKSFHNCWNGQKEKSILILINSLSELHIFSKSMGEFLYFMIHKNEANIEIDESKEKLQKLHNNIRHLEAHVQEKIVSKCIYMSSKTLSLYDSYIRGVLS